MSQSTIHSTWSPSCWSRRRRFFFNFEKCLSEKADDVISGVAVGHAGMDVHVKFCDSRSNSSRDIRAAQFVMDEWRRRMTTPQYAGHHHLTSTRHTCVCLKMAMAPNTTNRSFGVCIVNDEFELKTGITFILFDLQFHTPCWNYIVPSIERPSLEMSQNWRRKLPAFELSGESGWHESRTG